MIGTKRPAVLEAWIDQGAITISMQPPSSTALSSPRRQPSAIHMPTSTTSPTAKGTNSRSVRVSSSPPNSAPAMANHQGRRLRHPAVRATNVAVIMNAPRGSLSRLLGPQ